MCPSIHYKYHTSEHLSSQSMFRALLHFRVGRCKYAPPTCYPFIRRITDVALTSTLHVIFAVTIRFCAKCSPLQTVQQHSAPATGIPSADAQQFHFDHYPPPSPSAKFQASVWVCDMHGIRACHPNRAERMCVCVFFFPSAVQVHE